VRTIRNGNMSRTTIFFINQVRGRWFLGRLLFSGPGDDYTREWRQRSEKLDRTSRMSAMALESLFFLLLWSKDSCGLPIIISQHSTFRVPASARLLHCASSPNSLECAPLHTLHKKYSRGLVSLQNASFTCLNFTPVK
jgi:hypothetical protein